MEKLINNDSMLNESNECLASEEPVIDDWESLKLHEEWYDKLTERDL